MKLHLKVFELKLRHTFKIAHDVRDTQQTLIVALEHEGKIGYGEATANKYYGRPVEPMIEVLEEVREKIESSDLNTPELFIDELSELSTNSFAKCALDVAVHDLYGKLHGMSLMKYWGAEESAKLPTTSYTIGIDTIPKMVEKIKEFDWPLYKIKLGTSEDVDIIKELRQHTDAVFRVDANCAWTASQTIDYSQEFKSLNVEFIEQPMQAGNKVEAKEAYLHSALPLIADESCITESNVADCKGHFHGVNIKIMKCGGLSAARRMIANARQLDLSVMVGCMTESSVGISAIGQLLPYLDYVDMDGPLLITNDLADGPEYVDGKVKLSQRNGTGVEFKEDWI